MIPRRIFLLLDTLILLASFEAAHALAPALRPVAEAAARWVGRSAPALLPFVSYQTGTLPQVGELLWILIVIVPAVLFTLESMQAYGGLRHVSRTRAVLAGPVALGAGLSAAALLIFALNIQAWSRLFFFLFGLIAAAGLSGVRVLVRAYHEWQARAGYYTRNLLAVAPEDRVPQLVRFVAAYWPGRDRQWIGYLEAGRRRAMRLAAGARPAAVEPMGTAVEERDGVSVTSAVTVSLGSDSITLPRFGSVGDVNGMLVRRPVHEVVAVLPEDDGDWFHGLMAACDKVGVPLRVVPDALLTAPLSNLRCVREVPDRGSPSILLSVRDLSEEAVHVKRLMDVVVSAALLVLLSPVFLLAAVLVRLSGPGPILYRWHVVGQSGKAFTGYKFRTMVPNADALKRSLLQHNEMRGAVFKMRHDPRITPAGRWLRKYSLDELPQLWNVFKGDMSLVGPRPAFPNELERYEFWHMRKLSIRPGMTCLWQVRGRNAIDNFDEWVRMDLEYIDAWSLWTDVKILARTVAAVVKGTGH
ncbi:MAG TPA: sugar transferase [Dehalococcoidia bacterium]|nr:sugar transferase [Dehalococcoidia bacterium]